jgi:hypothetical protein
MAVRVTTVTLSVDNKEHEERLPDLPGSCGAWCLLEPAQVLIVPQTPLHFSPLMLDPSQISALNVGLGIFNACFMKFLFRQEPRVFAPISCSGNRNCFYLTFLPPVPLLINFTITFTKKK